MPKFGILRQNLQPFEKVIIGNTSDQVLDGVEATVVGRAFGDEECMFYILLLEDGYLYNHWPAITLSEACIARKNQET